MSDTQHETPSPEAEAPTAEAPEGDAKKNDLIETAIGLAVLGLGAAVLGGGRGLGGIIRTVANGPSQRTPPIAPGGPGVVDSTLGRRWPR